MEFTVCCQFDRKDLSQYESFIKRLRYQKIYTLIYVLTAGILGLLLILTLVQAFRHLLTKELAVRIALVFALVALWFPTREFRISVALLGHRKTGPLTMRFTEEHIVLSHGEKRDELPYEGFTEFYRFRRTNYLFVAPNKPFLFPEHCFTQGDLEAFGAFISEKTGLELKEIN